jgi:hypothetical protein
VDFVCVELESVEFVCVELASVESVLGNLGTACAQLFSAQAGHTSKRYSPILVIFDVFKEIAGHSYLSLDMSRFRTLHPAATNSAKQKRTIKVDRRLY